MKRQCSPFSPLPLQSMPNFEFFSFTCRERISVSVSIGDKPLFSARASGIASRADANARIAYCSIVGIFKKDEKHVRDKRLSSWCYLVCSFWHCNRTTYLRWASPIHNPVVNHKVTNCTDGIVKRTFGLINNLLKVRMRWFWWKKECEKELPSCYFPWQRWLQLVSLHIPLWQASCRELYQKILRERCQLSQASLSSNLQNEVQCDLV